VVAHFHFIMVGSTIMAFLGGLHFWWPKITGKTYNEKLARSTAIIIFVGFNMTFLAQFILGYLGMPRRYHLYPPEFQIWNIISSMGAGVLGLGYLLPMIYLPLSLFRGQPAAANPWQAKGLEWQVSSPPPPHNFEKTPVVTEEAYAYPEEA
jgi:cytochrome c oxidase subunit I